MTARALTSGMLAAITGAHMGAAMFYEGEFVDGAGATAYVRFWSGVGDMAWGGKNFRGGGNLLTFSPIMESTENKAVGFTVSLSGQPEANRAVALAGTQRNRSGRLWLGLFDSAGNLIADPYLVMHGRFSSMPVDDSAAEGTITVNYEDILATLQRPVERRYDSQSQALRDSTDRGFEYVEALQNAVFDFLPG